MSPDVLRALLADIDGEIADRQRLRAYILQCYGDPGPATNGTPPMQSSRPVVNPLVPTPRTDEEPRESINGADRARAALPTKDRSPAPKPESPSAAEKAVGYRLPAENGGTTPSKRTREEHRRRLLLAIASRGPRKQNQLLSEVGIPLGSSSVVLDCPWFERQADGIHLTSEGEAELERIREGEQP